MIIQHLVNICANVLISLHNRYGIFYIKIEFVITCCYKTHRNKFSSKGTFINMKRQSYAFLRISRIF
jgi:hypothetical protein